MANGGWHKTADATAPAADAVAIVTSDVTVLPITRAIYVGVAGNLTVTMARTGNIVTFLNVPVGIFPIQVTQVRAATTATDMFALY